MISTMDRKKNINNKTMFQTHISLMVCVKGNLNQTSNKLKLKCIFVYGLLSNSGDIYDRISIAE
jgi:hypothetical protein